jgi:hypothetical protein
LWPYDPLHSTWVEHYYWCSVSVVQAYFKLSLHAMVSRRASVVGYCVINLHWLENPSKRMFWKWRNIISLKRCHSKVIHKLLQTFEPTFKHATCKHAYHYRVSFDNFKIGDNWYVSISSLLTEV